MKIAVLGGGSVGKRHIGNLITKGIGHDNIHVVEPRSDRRDEINAQFKIANFCEHIEQLPFDKLAGAILATPTAMHIGDAITIAGHGIQLLIEKPVGSNLDQIEELKTAVSKNNIAPLIGYCFRFSEHGRALKHLVDDRVVGRPLFVCGEFSEYLPDWHPWEDYRSFYMASGEMGGGSLLDQSHVLDMAHWLFGAIDEVFAFSGNQSDLDVTADDHAIMQVRFESGLIGSVHQDMFGREHKKSIEIKCSDGNIYWDVYDHSVTVYHAETKSHEVHSQEKDNQLMYLNELQHFLDLIEGDCSEPLCSLEDGIHDLRVIHAARRSVKSSKLEKVGS